MEVQSSKIRKVKNIAIRILIVAIAWLALSRQLKGLEELGTVAETFLSKASSFSFWLGIIPALLAMIVNWSIEAIKWKLLTSKSEKISFLRSLQAVFTGITVGTFTPNRIGEFAGRAFALEKSHPWKVLFMTMVGSFGQLLVTIMAGVAGFFLFVLHINRVTTGNFYLDLLIALLIIASVGFMTLFYFHIDLVNHYFGKWISKWWPKFGARIGVFSEYSTKELFNILGLSVLRYSIFSWQFIYLMKFLGVAMPYGEALIYISVSFLVMTLIPTEALSEIGVRGSVTLHFFGYHFGSSGPDTHSALALITASSLLWIINLVVPALLGTVFVYKLKVFRNGKNKTK